MLEKMFRVAFFPNEIKLTNFPALYSFVEVYFGSALFSKSGIALPVLKLLILLATETSSVCFLLRESASKLKIMVRYHRYNK